VSRYATPTDLANLAINSGALTGISSDDQQSALDAASGLADGYLRARFILPLVAPFSQDLVRAVCGIAAYDLLTRRGYNPIAEGANDNWRLRYKDAIGWLEKVAAGNIAPALTDSSGDSSAPKAPRVISRCRRGW